MEIVAAIMFLGWSMIVSKFVPGIDWERIGRNKFFLYIVVIFAAKEFSKTWHWSVGLFYLWAMFGFLYSGMPVSAIWEVFMITSALFIIPKINLKKDIMENIFLITGIAHSIMGIVHIIGYNPFWRLYAPWLQGIPRGFLGHPTMLGPYLCFCLCLSLYRSIELFNVHRIKSLSYFAISLLFIGIIIACKSVMVLLSLFAVILTFIVFYKGIKYFSYISALFLASGSIYYFVNERFFSFTGRLGVGAWPAAWTLFKENVFFGYGVGTWSTVAEIIAEKRPETGWPWGQLHFDFLQGLFEFGSIGMLFIVIYLFIIFGFIYLLYVFKDKEELPYIAGLMLLLVNSVGNFPFHVMPLGIIALICCYRIQSKFSRDIISYYSGY